LDAGPARVKEILVGFVTTRHVLSMQVELILNR